MALGSAPPMLALLYEAGEYFGRSAQRRVQRNAVADLS